MLFHKSHETFGGLLFYYNGNRLYICRNKAKWVITDVNEHAKQNHNREKEIKAGDLSNQNPFSYTRFDTFLFFLKPCQVTKAAPSYQSAMEMS